MLVLCRSRGSVTEVVCSIVLLLGYLAFCGAAAGLMCVCILLCDSGEEDGNCSEEMHVVKYSTRCTLCII